MAKTKGIMAATCKVCFEEGLADDPLLSVCPCKGTVKWVHDSCLRRWFAEGHNDCFVCKTPIRMEEGTDAEILPYMWPTLFQNSLLQACIETICNFYFYMFVMQFWDPEAYGSKYFFWHAAYQQIYYTFYAAFCWWRWICRVKKKRLYVSMIWGDVQSHVYIQLGCVLGQWFIHNPLYNISSVMLSRYLHHALLMAHYTTLEEMNQLVPFVFVAWPGNE